MVIITFSAVVKPYEPPGLGKPSRVTPVGLDEDPDALSTDSLLESDSVEVLSVIRFNKSKFDHVLTYNATFLKIK